MVFLDRPARLLLIGALALSSTAIASAPASAGEIAACSARTERSDARQFVYYGSDRFTGWTLSTGELVTFTMEPGPDPFSVQTILDLSDRTATVEGVVRRSYRTTSTTVWLFVEEFRGGPLDLIRVTEGSDPVIIDGTAGLTPVDGLDDGRLIVQDPNSEFQLMSPDGSLEPFLENQIPQGYVVEFRFDGYAIGTMSEPSETIMVQGDKQRILPVDFDATRGNIVYTLNGIVTLVGQEIADHTIDETQTYLLDDPDEHLRLVSGNEVEFFLADFGFRDDGPDEPAAVYRFDRATSVLTLLGIAPTGSLVAAAGVDDISVLFERGEYDDSGSIPAGSAPLVSIANEPRFVNGGERSDRITRLYEAFFDRTPGEVGLNYWRARANDPIAIADAFANSIEFEATYGTLDDLAFVELIYTNVLDRAADQAGLDFWTDQLGDGLSRGELIVSFSDGPEFVERTSTRAPNGQTDGSIHRLYLAFFERAPDIGGLCYWSEQLRMGNETLATAASGFANSVEFDETYGDLDDAAFIELVYTNVLDRPLDAEGAAFWLDQLTSGMSRGDVMLNFSDSLEFRLLTDTL